MPVRPRHYHRPDDLKTALDLLAAGDAAPLAGGTRLLAGDIPVSTVVDLQDLNLSGIELSGDRLHIGATTRLTDIASSPTITTDYGDLLRQAIHAAGPNTFRNAATLGGVIASREPDSELLALLLVLGASLIIAAPDGETTLRLADYLNREPNRQQIITRIDLPLEKGRGAMERVARTPADDPIVAVVGWQASGDRARLAATGIDHVPVRLYQAEETEALDDQIAAAQGDVNHPGDFRGTTAYRREMVGVLLRRVLKAIQQQ